MMNEIKNAQTIKFLMYITLFTVIVFAFVFLFVIPGIKTYQTSLSEQSSTAHANEKLLKEQEMLRERLKTLKAEQATLIETFSQEFNATHFIAFSKKYFDEVSLNQVGEESNSSALKVYAFSADIKAKNPKKFYDFVNELEKYQGIIKINFPIKIVSEGELLKINLLMSAYSMPVK